MYTSNNTDWMLEVDRDGHFFRPLAVCHACAVVGLVGPPRLAAGRRVGAVVLLVLLRGKGRSLRGERVLGVGIEGPVVGRVHWLHGVVALVGVAVVTERARCSGT